MNCRLDTNTNINIYTGYYIISIKNNNNNILINKNSTHKYK